MTRFVTYAVVGLAMCLSACGGDSALTGGPAVSVVDASVLPPPQREDVLGQTREYVIGPYDKLSVSVFGVEQLADTEVQVDASGNMAFPLVGNVRAAGLTPGELTRELESGLRQQFIRDPHVTVNLNETVSQVVTVEGEVKRPGLYPVIGRMTLLRAVARAEGLTEFAKLDHVVLFRRVADTQYAALYSVKQIRSGAMADPEIYANDVVVVGESRARRIFKDILQASPLLTSPIVAVLNNSR